MNIPDKFYNAEIEQPSATTVGELKKLLAELPDNLAVHDAWCDPVVLTVYNHDSEDEHLEFGEVD